MRIGGKKQAKQRPEFFRLDATHPLATGLVFAGLGFMGSQKSLVYHDSVAELRGITAANHGLLTGYSTDPTNADSPEKMVKWVPELGRWALDFDGSNDSVVFPANAFDSLYATRQVTLACWCKTTSTTANIRVIELEGAYALRFSITTTGKAEAMFDGSDPGIEATTTVNDGAWHHVAGTTKGNVTTVYIDGKAENSGAETIYDITSLSRVSRLGARWTDANWFPGFLSDPLILNRALTSSEIALLADRSDPMLGGLILPPRRRFWGAVTAAPATNRRRRLLIGAAA